MQKEEIYNLLNNPGEFNTQTTRDLQTIVEKYPYFQLAQILYLKHLKEISSPEFNIVLKKVAIQIPNRKQLYHFLNTKIQNQKTSEFDFKKENIPSFKLENYEEINQGDSLIDKFLSSAQVAINRNKVDGQQTQNTENEFLKNSETENDELVTETLAMIYFQQKKYDKALDSFRKLSLKYPEKSAYFATRIEEIEKLKNI